MRLLLPAPVRPTTPSLVLPAIVKDTSLHDTSRDQWSLQSITVPNVD
jgi:hypothetical protein